MIEAKRLKKYFPVERGFFRRKTGEVKAVDGVDLFIGKGKTLGLVGESGCGKTTLGKLLLGLLEPDSGEIIKEKGLKTNIVFQDPFGSLNPRMRVEQIVTEGLKIEKRIEHLKRSAERLMDTVELPRKSLAKYPHQFSGGERQRISIARAIATKPNFIVCDEPVSSLDVSIRVQILTLLVNLQKEFGLSYLFIAHDLGAVRHMSSTVAVMYLGKIVEYGPKEEIYKRPLHPYTKSLLLSAPTPYPKAKKEKVLLKGDVPSAVNPPEGCRFHTRCPYAFEVCPINEPLLMQYSTNHFCACHLHQPKSNKNI
ncbi:MAG: peptide ABC transporter substrate-binding protein [Candidatus Omnitrophica bacterium CG07_land_8_20_14_0_80_42_15]|uniref:Peptide ABC transporter substrate-binding protein n=1 Tax=Candidatus Aquitaenariimonas noxiae TaxID=1974741 RepID=A0A2J0KXH6_9BACT|nr:MAG: peptide ABC transporter substrate-binding protein [Candidatus Omnitrophica bacterium CG07_land_8_20_14_0_80_42_15]